MLPMDMKIVAGTVNLDRPRVTHAVKEIITHKEYDIENSWLNDIALIRVNCLSIQPIVSSKLSVIDSRN